MGRWQRLHRQESWGRPEIGGVGIGELMVVRVAVRQAQFPSPFGKVRHYRWSRGGILSRTLACETGSATAGATTTIKALSKAGC